MKLSIRSVLFILLALFSDEIINTILTIGGTPYRWIMDSELPPLSFADFNSVMLVIIGVCANGAVALITLILVVILAWNYLKLLLEAAERYVLLGVLVYTAPVAFAMGASPNHIKHLEILVSDAGRADFSAAYERLVPAPIYEHGWFVYLQPAFALRRGVMKKLRRILFLALMVGFLPVYAANPLLPPLRRKKCRRR